LSRNKPIIAITMGDPAGAGPELAIKALRRKRLYSEAQLLLIGDLRVFERAAKIVGASEIRLMKTSDATKLLDSPKVANVLDLKNADPAKIVYGKPSSLGGKASYEAVVRAVELALDGRVHAIVTAPISKESLNLAGYHYPGHTELLAELTRAKDVKMMLVAGDLRVVHVTTHVSLRKAIDMIKRDRVLKTIRLVNSALIEYFDIPRPRIAVAGLNPHAGESGLFGDEEIKEIKPAIEAASAEGINASGPYPPDSIFYRAYHDKTFDAVVAMYHDQGHIAVKMIGFMHGINLTLGLPIIRTSPDHGTVWDKAGKGIADESATLEAIKLAIKLAKRKFGIM